jgi:hypothetical protein
MARTKTAASWSSVKAGLREFDRTALLGLLQDLYGASKENQAFLHARLNLGSNPLDPYKAAISRWICPDVLRNRPVSVAKAKKAISDYKKAIGHPEGMAELTTFYCEEVIAFLNSCGMEDEGYYAALIRMFEQALKWAMHLSANSRTSFLDRLHRVREAGRRVGWGVGDELGCLWDEVAEDA